MRKRLLPLAFLTEHSVCKTIHVCSVVSVSLQIVFCAGALQAQSPRALSHAMMALVSTALFNKPRTNARAYPLKQNSYRSFVGLVLMRVTGARCNESSRLHHLLRPSSLEKQGKIGPLRWLHFQLQRNMPSGPLLFCFFPPCNQSTNERTATKCQ